MKYLLICNSSQNVITFRKSLILHLLEAGNEVVVIASDNDYRTEIEALGVTMYVCNANNRSISIAKTLSYKRSVRQVIKKEKPDVVFTFQVKPNTFGAFAARKEKIKTLFCMVEGAGDVFIKNGLKWKIIRFFVCKLYKKAFKSANKVFFLNNDDKAEFIARKLVKEKQSVVIPGIGVDTEYFAFKPIKNHKTFLMVARMLKTKGVMEYCKAARIVKQKYPDAVFNYLGAEGDLKIADIQEFIDDGSINYLGTTKDVRPYIENSLLLLLLSSYREGLPMSIMEAESVGRGIITSNNVGCKDTVIDGYNGFLIERGDYTAMAEKVIWCIEHPRETEEMGKNARKYAEENFDQNKINSCIMKSLMA